MPEHVHLLLTEPKRTKLSVALQMLKQNVARRLREPQRGPLWQPRYYDFNVWSYAKQTEKLRYIHRNPVRRGWCGVRKSGSGAVSGIIFPALKVWLRSSRNGRRASGEQMRSGLSITGKGSQNPHPVAQNATRAGHPLTSE
jgi:hypothetical protein